MEPVTVCIVGPTASGKSELADRLAFALGTTVISVDAMQVYRGMDIGTAKVPAAERRVALEMVDICDVSDTYSVERFQKDARACVDRAIADGRIPILCGGTGLYLDAVIDEMDFPAGKHGDARRTFWEQEAECLGPDELYAVLQQRDPASASLIHPHNVRRCIRALELADEGLSYAKQHEGLLKRTPHYHAVLYAPAVPREKLYTRIDERVDQMFAEGLLDEVRQLQTDKLKQSVTASQAIGYKEALAVLDNEMSLEDAIQQTKTRTRHYAKRQLNWLRRDGRVHWLDIDTLGVDGAVDYIQHDISKTVQASQSKECM
ncbi:MAG TPA: tRNA (adenosine(37)-N6)-dimethylallyltransferase MiaA [Candidatus Coprovicinus avistercoris]|uniref:tRNA dimethylallyltransferase n=1 Tax=Candidatus Coprovicinus avistercoris TaxID=2840754 RepID=A0A9D1HX62_9ACTN|nr:tRNA (adenosine(37)-N6)-dimethylallyltransferase MiaA [Candidatus Coprovicinus avistercoris]